MRSDETTNMVKYVDAVRKAIEEAPLRHGDVIEISDLWVITSLPSDLIVECVKNEEFSLPSYVKKIVYGKRVILRNKNYTAFEGEK